MAFYHQTDSNFHIPIPHSTSCEIKEVCPHIAQVCPLLVPSVCVHVILLLRLLLVFILVFTNQVLKFNQSLLATLFVNSDYHYHLFILFSCQLMLCVGGGQ